MESTGLHFQKARRRILWIGAVVVVLFAGGVGLWLAWPQPTPPPPVAEVKKEEPARPVGLQGRVLFFGNIYWGRYINDWSQASPLKEAYPFSRLHEFGRESYDAWVAGLECPTVEGVSMSSAVEDDTLQFNCSPRYLTEAAKWFTVLSSANNHSDNQGGQTGLNETRRRLDEHGIQYFGHFDPRVLPDICEVIALPVRITFSDAHEQKGSLPIAMCGFHGVFRRPAPEAIEVMQRYAKVIPVVAYRHMGAEYQPEPDHIREQTYRAMIDNGADMVLGDHPHWVQTSEAYKGKPIIYSMGNFIFDQQYNKEVTRSAGIDVTFKVDGASPELLTTWLTLGETCKAFQDSCLQLAEEQGLQRLPVAFHIKIVGTDNSGKIAKPAKADIQASILQRLRWAETLKGLSVPFSGE